MGRQTPTPHFYAPGSVQAIRRVEYAALAAMAPDYVKQNNITAAAKDKVRIALMGIDIQFTFCHPDFELPVGNALEDCVRTAEFIYHNLHCLTSIHLTMDTHKAFQIFHPAYWVNDKGEHPAPLVTIITQDDVMNGVWKVNPGIASSIAGGNYAGLQKDAEYYVQKLTEGGRYPLIVWPYHAMLGGIGHAIIPLVEEAARFHGFCRNAELGYEIKGGHPLRENYSIFRPEVLTGPGEVSICQKNSRFLKVLMDHDVVIICGQAKSHCVAWTIADLLDEINVQDPTLARKVYLVEDLTSPVIVPGVIDFTQQANDAFARFAAAGMNVVRSTTPIEGWPGVNL